MTGFLLLLLQVYSETVEPIVPLIFQRTKATCFAYGQTGKSSGNPQLDSSAIRCDDILTGLVCRIF